MAWFPYITEQQVPQHVKDALDDVGQAIRDASHAVRRELKTARFDIDGDGIPTDEQVAGAIRDATIAQLAFWAETGDMTGAGAQSGGGSILSVSMPGGNGALDTRSKQAAREAPATAEILRSCPGINWAVMHW